MVTQENRKTLLNLHLNLHLKIHLNLLMNLQLNLLLHHRITHSIMQKIPSTGITHRPVRARLPVRTLRLRRTLRGTPRRKAAALLSFTDIFLFCRTASFGRECTRKLDYGKCRRERISSKLRGSRDQGRCQERRPIIKSCEECSVVKKSFAFSAFSLFQFFVYFVFTVLSIFATSQESRKREKKVNEEKIIILAEECRNPTCW